MKSKLIALLLIFQIAAPMRAAASSTRAVQADSLVSSDRSKTWSFPSATDTFAGISAVQELSNKTFTNTTTFTKSGDGIAVTPISATAAGYMTFNNTGGVSTLGIESSVGSNIVTGAPAYSLFLNPASGRKFVLGYNGGAGIAMLVDTSGQVGIGTTSPSAIFHSKAGATTQGAIHETTSTSSLLSFADSGTSSYTRVQLGSTGNNLVAVMNGTEAMRIDSSGNVGIGTTAATSKLTVSANTAAPQSPGTGTTVHVVGADANPGRFVLDAYGGNANFIYRRANGTAAAPTAVNTSAPIGSVAFFGYGSTGYSATNRAYINVIASETWTDTAQGTSMYFGTTTTGTTTVSERMRIGNDGNIGIGNISDAASRLEILAPGVTTGTDEQISLRSSRAAIVSGNMIGGVNFKSNDTNLSAPGTVVALIDAVAAATHTASVLDTAITFQTTTGTTMAERMRIAADGSVGIGTTAPSNTLEVSGTFKASGAIQLSNLSTAGVVKTDSSGNLSSEAQLASSRGGTGVNNAGTLTYGSNNITLTTSGATGVTLPTSGTLATLAGSEILSNKTLSSATLSGTTAGPGSTTIASDGKLGVNMAPSSGDALDVAGGVRSIRTDNAKFVMENTGVAGSFTLIYRTGTGVNIEEGATSRLTVASGGDVVMGTGALATTATAGFFYMDSMAGTPTGVPTSRTGRVPFVYDTTNHKICVYDPTTPSWRCSAAM